MSATVSDERWDVAQKAEAEFWDVQIGPGFFYKMLVSYQGYLNQLGPERTSQLFDNKEIIDLGVGPFLFSPVSIYENKETVKRLVKLEPLPVRRLGDWAHSKTEWRKPFVRWLESLAEEGEFLNIPGEELAFVGEFDTVLSFNALDHVKDPGIMLQNACRALRDGGRIALFVDCLSWVGRLRFRWFVKPLLKNSVLVRAHPHQFCLWDVEALLVKAGFQDIECIDPPSLVDRLAGRSGRVVFMARK